MRCHDDNLGVNSNNKDYIAEEGKVRMSLLVGFRDQRFKVVLAFLKLYEKFNFEQSVIMFWSLLSYFSEEMFLVVIDSTCPDKSHRKEQITMEQFGYVADNVPETEEK